MKTLMVSALLMLAVPAAQAAGKLAFINPTVLLTQAPQALAASRALEAEFSPREQELQKMVHDINVMQEKLKKDAAILSDTELKKRESEILEKVRVARIKEQGLKEDLNRRRTEATRQLNQEVSAVIQQYGKEQGYDFIFTEGVAYAGDSVNITDAILERLKTAE